MTEYIPMSDTEWQTEASTARRRRLAPWIGTIVLSMIGGMAIGGAAALDASATRTILIAIGVAAGLGALAWSTVIYMRVIDEQERDANLWGAYVGICAYLVLYPLRWTFHVLGQQPPFSHDAIFVAVMAVVIVVFLWKRFR